MDARETRSLVQNLESSALAYELLGEKELPRLLRSAAAALTPPKEPDNALLANMAMCLNHGFGLDTPERQQSQLRDMRKLWDEVMGRGYYSPAGCERYVAAINPPEGFVLVPVQPTEAMVAAAEEAYMPFGDMGFAISAALASAALAARPEEI